METIDIVPTVDSKDFLYVISNENFWINEKFIRRNGEDVKDIMKLIK